MRTKVSSAALTWPVAGVAELAALAGFDFVLIDVEHGFFSIESVASTILACDGAGIAPLVRPPSALSDQVGRYLDAGAAGTLLPRVESVAMARSAIEALKFAPLGRRGLGGVRANRYATEPLANFVTRANDETLVAVQIEREGALAELAGLADEPAVDVLFVGPNDLLRRSESRGRRRPSAIARPSRELPRRPPARGRPPESWSGAARTSPASPSSATGSSHERPRALPEIGTRLEDRGHALLSGGGRPRRIQPWSA